MEKSSEQNKTEEATPFKLKRARERGTVARGVDLGFFAALSGFAIFAIIAGSDSLTRLTEAIRRLFNALPVLAHDSQQLLGGVSLVFAPMAQIVAAMGMTIMLIVVLLEIIQVRGIVFTSKPLKPDFSRLDPGKGLKRLFSLRMLQETLKSIVKLIAYTVGSYLVLKWAFESYATSLDSAPRLGEAIQTGGLRLLFAFILIAMFVAIIDQVIARREFQRQMRMSRSELTREHKEREGEPRLRQKRKQLHAEFASQTRSFSALAGSDMLIVNPQHYAVALKYDPKTMSAPKITAKGRNQFALHLRHKATVLSIAVFERPKLARALHKNCGPGEEVPGQLYPDVADLYLQLMKSRVQRNDNVLGA
jgi:flagellar biosynthesis protein FlhB